MFGLVMAVGPGDREVARMQDTLGMVAAHERPADAHLVLIDDDPTPRDLDPRWPHQTVLRTPIRQRRNPDPYSAMTAATLAGLTVCRERDLDLAVKLDTDAAVIAPFSERLRQVVAKEQVGVVGSYDRTSSGDVRDWTMWERPLARAHRQWHITHGSSGRPVLWRKRLRDRRRARRLCEEAARRAPVGAHCLGGAYAVSSSFLNRAELDWEPWVGTDLSEDVVVGTLCAASGLQMRSLVAPGEPFALAWQGLPASPPEIRAARHSIVHSVKADSLNDERRLRAQLAGAASEPDPTPRGQGPKNGVET